MIRLSVKTLGALCLIFCGAAFGDEIAFSNGERLTGRLVSVHGGIVAFQSDNLGLLRIRASAKLSLLPDSHVKVEMNDGTTYEGSLRPSTAASWSLATEDNTQLVAIAPDQVANLSLASVTEITASQADITATESRENVWEGAKDRPGLLGPWSIDTRLALSGVYSAKNRQLLHWNGELIRTSHVGDFQFTGERIYGTSTNQNGKTTTDDDLTRGELSYTKNVTQRMAAYIHFEGLHDEARSIDKRLIVSGGLHYKLFAGERVTITPFAGPAWIQYSYLANKNVTSAPLSFAAVQFGCSSLFRLPGKLEITQDFAFDQGYRGDGAYLSHLDVRVRRPITKWLYLDGKITDDFDSKAAYAANGNTFRYSAGIGFKFDAF